MNKPTREIVLQQGWDIMTMTPQSEVAIHPLALGAADHERS
jgi:hypothetical protein